jgi:hypothetical protein
MIESILLIAATYEPPHAPESTSGMAAWVTHTEHCTMATASISLLIIVPTMALIITLATGMINYRNPH